MSDLFSECTTALQKCSQIMNGYACDTWISRVLNYHEWL